MAGKPYEQQHSSPSVPQAYEMDERGDPFHQRATRPVDHPDEHQAWKQGADSYFPQQNDPPSRLKRAYGFLCCGSRWGCGAWVVAALLSIVALVVGIVVLAHHQPIQNSAAVSDPAFSSSSQVPATTTVSTVASTTLSVVPSVSTQVSVSTVTSTPPDTITLTQAAPSIVFITVAGSHQAPEESVSVSIVTTVSIQTTTESSTSRDVSTMTKTVTSSGDTQTSMSFVYFTMTISGPTQTVISTRTASVGTSVAAPAETALASLFGPLGFDLMKPLSEIEASLTSLGAKAHSLDAAQHTTDPLIESSISYFSSMRSNELIHCNGKTVDQEWFSKHCLPGTNTGSASASNPPNSATSSSSEAGVTVMVTATANAVIGPDGLHTLASDANIDSFTLVATGT